MSVHASDVRYSVRVTDHFSQQLALARAAVMAIRLRLNTRRLMHRYRAVR